MKIDKKTRRYEKEACSSKSIIDGISKSFTCERKEAFVVLERKRTGRRLRIIIDAGVGSLCVYDVVAAQHIIYACV